MTNEEKKRRGLLPRGLAGLIGFSTAVAAAWIFYSRRYIDHHAKVKGVLKGEEGFYESLFSPVSDRARKLTVGLRIPGVLFINFHRRIVSFSETSSYILRMVGRPCYNTGS